MSRSSLIGGLVKEVAVPSWLEARYLVHAPSKLDRGMEVDFLFLVAL